MEMGDTEPLLAEIQIGNVTICNRFVRSATHEWLADSDGRPTAEIGALYEQLAQNNVGLIISGYSYITRCGRSSERQQGIYDDRCIEDYAALSRRINKHGSRFFIQVVHGGRQALKIRDCPGPISPSLVSLPEDSDIPGKKKYPEQIDEEGIGKIIDDFVKAIDCARRAKVDGVQLHCAHGFLLSNFLSPYTNRREDDWGGDTDRRARIVIEILRRAKRQNDDFPIAVKMNAWDGVKGGTDLGEATKIAKILDSEGIDAIEVSGGIEDARTEITCVPDIRSEKEEAYFREYSKAIKRSIECPIILVGGNRSLKVMSKMITEGFADMISLSRPLIREPDLIKKFINGETDRAACASCNGCFDETGIKCNYDRN